MLSAVPIRQLDARSPAFPCPTENAIVGFMQGRGTASDLRAIEAHLDACLDCHVLIAEVARATTREFASLRRAGSSSESLVAAAAAAAAVSGATASSSAARGVRAGRYRLEEMLGAGAMGVVYAAYDDELDRRVAVKVVRSEWSGSEQHRVRLLREACAMARVVHPNVVTVHDVGTMDGNVFIAMEHVDGSSLKHWLEGRPRGWREILDVLLGAARGLAAAHEAGIVHRDFKPQNVLVDSHARAVVADFGLACPIGGRTLSPTSGAAARRPLSSDRETSALTATGTILGTPAYMAPEQRAGGTTDTRSDQYSFCVVLYEALFGVRPFERARQSRTRPGLRRGSSPPAWLKRTLQRGLELDPARRYPSMDALAVALQPKKSARWLLPLCALAVVAGVASASLGWRRHVLRERESCVTAARGASAVWNDVTIARTRDAFMKTHLPYAEATLQGVERQLGSYVASWSTMRLQVCTDGLRAGPSELMRRQENCLADRLDEFRASTDLMATVDGRTVKGAPTAVSALIPPEQCSNVNGLPPLLSDPTKAEKLRDIHGRLARGRALINVGRYREALEPVEDAVRAADLLQYGPVQSDAQINLGTVLHNAGAAERANEAFLRGLALADAAGNDRLRINAWVGLLVNLSFLHKGYDRIPLYELEARAALQRLGGDELLEATLRAALAFALMQQGNLEEAKSEAEWTLAVRRRRFSPDDPTLGTALKGLGEILLRQGRYEEARAAFQGAVDVFTKAWGADWPAISGPLSNIAAALLREGKSAEALPYAERALALATSSLPDNHPSLAMDLDMRGAVFEALGRYEEARRDEQRVVEMFEKRFGRESPLLVGPLTTLGNVSLGLGEVKAAVATLERAMALCGADCTKIDRADVTFALAQALRRAGRQPKRALALADDAAEGYRTLGDPRAASVQSWRQAR